LVQVFVRRIVPWSELVAEPNSGHQAIADLLLTSAADVAVSTNYDQLIEMSAWNFGADFTASLDGNDANVHSGSHRPLLKVHGCSNRDRDHTVWTRQQIATDPIQTRIRSSAAWLAANLREKDLLVVDFWSDWSYLNEVLETCLASAHPAAVVAVDPASSSELEAKAPGLWSIFHSGGITFQHEQASGAELLNELRAHFSHRFLRIMLMDAKGAFETKFSIFCPETLLDTDGMSVDELYAWRRDAEGQRGGRPARLTVPGPNCQSVGFFHLALRHLGAVREGVFYRFRGELIRIVNGAGRWLSDVKEHFSHEAPIPPEVDKVFCVGADDLGVPSHILRGGGSTTVVRPAGRGTWLDSASARSFMGI
jgi:hypothetical protein